MATEKVNPENKRSSSKKIFIPLTILLLILAVGIGLLVWGITATNSSLLIAGGCIIGVSVLALMIFSLYVKFWTLKENVKTFKRLVDKKEASSKEA